MTSRKNNNVLGSKKLDEKAAENEIKTVSYEDHEEALNDLRRKYQGTPVSILDINRRNYVEKRDPIRLGIRCTLGTVSVEKAEECVFMMQQAIEDCKNYKYDGYTIVD